jgi:hypothetical protein
MSWDVFIMNLPLDAQTVDEIPDDFDPAPLGARAEVIEKIREVAPSTDFSDSSWGMIDGGGYWIEVNLGRDEVVNCCTLHVRGGDLAVPCVLAIIERLEARALDTSGEFVTPDNTSAGLRQWRACRDRVIGSPDAP